MFGIFTSAQSRARKDAQNWLHLAGKVYHFRRDQLPVQEIEALQLAMHELRTRVKERADAAKLKMGIEKLEGCLRQSGGTFYPKSSLVDNVEFFLVAMILFLGIRAFIIQPFKIPTNSMWPTYFGMTAEAYVPEPTRGIGEQEEFGTVVLHPAEAEPNSAMRAARWLTLGASPHRIDAPADGEIYVPWWRQGPPSVPVAKRQWLIFPGEARQYRLIVGNHAVGVTVPTDFRFDYLLKKVFFRTEADFEEAIQEAQAARRLGPEMKTLDLATRQIVNVRPLLLRTGRRVQAGERMLAFDVLTGDQLFVDRVSYHFVPPKVGDGFVFRTHHILGVERPGEYVDKYYIKRLVGLPGDELEVRDHTLYRNGEPITGAAAFEKNAEQAGRYSGYEPVGRLAPGETLTVDPDSFFAMGDNSPDSADSRYWGVIPERDAIGRPLWIYFPFTKRWGPSR